MNKPATEFDTFTAFRNDFPALKRWTYLDLAGRGILSGTTRAALDAHLDDRMMNGGDKDRFFTLIERTRGRFAQLINTDPGNIAYTKNVSDGLNMVATSIGLKAGDNVITCPDLEHPNNVYPWLNLQRLGVEVRMVKPRDYHMPVDDMITRMDARTRCVTASSVSFAPGFRTDIEKLGRACRERGVLFLVDAVQSAGVVHMDVRTLPVDAMAVSTQKGLLALYGMGFLYVRPEWAEKMQPAYLARFGVDMGEAHEAAMGDTSFKLAAGARRFDLGNYNYAAAAAVDASLAQLLEIGTQRIETHVTRLSHALAQGFLDMGVPVCGGKPGPHLAGIVTVGNYSTNHYGTDEARYDGLYNYLGENQVKLSIRRGMLRFSLHAYNSMDDIDHVLALSKKFLAGR